MKTILKTIVLVAVIAGLASCGSAPQNVIPKYKDPGFVITLEPK